MTHVYMMTDIIDCIFILFHRYVGNIRAINAGLLDAYLLKSLDGVAKTPVGEQAVFVKCGQNKSKICFFLKGPDDTVDLGRFSTRDPWYGCCYTAFRHYPTGITRIISIAWEAWHPYLRIFVDRVGSVSYVSYPSNNIASHADSFCADTLCAHNMQFRYVAVAQGDVACQRVGSARPPAHGCRAARRKLAHLLV